MLVTNENFTETVVPAFIDPNLTAVGLDVETSGLDPYSEMLLLIQLSTPDEVFVFNPGTVKIDYLKYILGLIKERNLITVAHNWKFDAKFIYHNFSIHYTNSFDTMIAENLNTAGLGKKFPSLEELAMKYLGINLDKEARKGFIGKRDYEFSDAQLNYAGNDALVLLPLKGKLEKKLKERGQWKTWKMEMELEPVVMRMEYIGITFDVENWKGLAKIAERERDHYDLEVKKIMANNFEAIAGTYAEDYTNAYEALENMHFGFSGMRVAQKKELKAITTQDEIKATTIPMVNFGSWRQALHVLQSLKVPTKSTSAKELEWYRKDHPIVEAKLSYAEWDKKASMYGIDFLKHINPFTYAIHANQNQTGTSTGRFSSDDPNLQNIIAEADYRSSFIAREGYLLGTYDYSQIELRIIAEVSGEPRFLDAFDRGIDLHTSTASVVFQVSMEDVTPKQRKFAKSLNFAVVYGTTAKGLAWNFAIAEAEAQHYLDVYFKEHSTLEFFIKRFGAEVLKNGYSVTMGGRRRFFNLPKQVNSRKGYKKLYQARRQGVNNLPQGTCGDMIKLSLIDMFYNNPFGWESFHPLLSVHDEIVVEFVEGIRDKADTFARAVMKKAGEVYLKRVSVEVDGVIDKHWRKA